MESFLLPFRREKVYERRFSAPAMLLASIAVVIVISLQSSIVTLILMIIGISIVGVVCHTRWRTVVPLVARFEIPVLFWLIFEPFIFGETVVAVVSSPLGSVPLYREGIVLGLIFVIRIFAILLLFMGTLSHITLSEFAGALRTLRVPNIILGALLIMLRYLPLFIEEQTRMVNAQTMRGLDVCGRRQRLLSWGSIVGATILRAMDRSQVVYQSMSMRGSTDCISVTGSTFRLHDTLLVVPVLFTVLCVFSLVYIVGVPF